MPCRCHEYSVSAKNLMKTLKEHVDIESTIMTDDFMSCRHVDEVFYQHHAVVHSKKEYVRGDAHVNNCESFFALLKRGLMGSFRHVSRKPTKKPERFSLYPLAPDAVLRRLLRTKPTKKPKP